MSESDLKVAKLKERQEVARLQREQDLKMVLATPAGRRLFWDILDRRCNVFGDPAVYGLADSARMTERNIGRRTIGIELMQDAQTLAYEQYAEMHRERTNTAINEAKTRAAEAVPRAGDPSST